MKAGEAIYLLNNGILPEPLDYNITHTERIDYSKLEYNDISKILYKNKNYKQLLSIPIFRNVIEKEIEELIKMGVTLENAIDRDTNCKQEQTLNQFSQPEF